MNSRLPGAVRAKGLWRARVEHSAGQSRDAADVCVAVVVRGGVIGINSGQRKGPRAGLDNIVVTDDFAAERCARVIVTASGPADDQRANDRQTVGQLQVVHAAIAGKRADDVVIAVRIEIRCVPRGRRPVADIFQPGPGVAEHDIDVRCAERASYAVGCKGGCHVARGDGEGTADGAGAAELYSIEACLRQKRRVAAVDVIVEVCAILGTDRRRRRSACPRRCRRRCWKPRPASAP